MSKKIVQQTVEEGLRSAWESYLRNNPDFSQATYDTYLLGFDRFLTWLRQQPAYPPTPQDIERWKGVLNRRMRPTTTNTFLSSMRNFYAWAVREKLLDYNPAENVKNIKREGANRSHLKDPLEDGEILSLLDVPDRETKIGIRDYAYLCIKAYTGLRDVELYRADIDDISYVSGTPIMRIRGKGRTDANRVAVIANPRAQDALLAWRTARGHQAGALFISLSNRSEGKRLTLSAIRHIVKRYMRLAGVDDPRKTSHSLRHSAISKVARQNVLKAQEIAGHADTKTTLIYVHEADRIDDPGEQYIEYKEV